MICSPAYTVGQQKAKPMNEKPLKTVKHPAFQKEDLLVALHHAIIMLKCGKAAEVTKDLERLARDVRKAGVR
jgi:Fe2+ or Zn2+ uptake regulation protein